MNLMKNLILTLLMTTATLSASETRIPASDERFQYIGRFNTEDKRGASFAWSASTIRFRFSGEQCWIYLQHVYDEDSEHNENYYTVFIDGKQSTIIRATPADSSFIIAENLPFAEHTVTIFRRTEAFCGVAIFLGIDLGNNGKLLSPPPRAKRRIEYIGDSITCGYGNEATRATDGFLPATEDAYRTYSAIVSRSLNAEYRSICFSGRGVFQNYDLTQENTMFTLFDRNFPQDTLSWDFSRWMPDVVVINLGTNDFAHHIPTEANFVNAYDALLRKVRSYYPEATIVCLDGSMVSGDNLVILQRYIKLAIERFKGDSDSRIEHFSLSTQGQYGYGANYHPNLKQNEVNGEELAIYLATLMGW